jgi:hypothetical protein
LRTRFLCRHSGNSRNPGFELESPAAMLSLLLMPLAARQRVTFSCPAKKK